MTKEELQEIKDEFSKSLQQGFALDVIEQRKLITACESLMKENEEIRSGYDKSMELSLTYHGEKERLQELVDELAGSIDDFERDVLDHLQDIDTITIDFNAVHLRSLLSAASKDSNSLEFEGIKNKTSELREKVLDQIVEKSQKLGLPNFKEEPSKPILPMKTEEILSEKHPSISEKNQQKSCDTCKYGVTSKMCLGCGDYEYFGNWQPKDGV